MSITSPTIMAARRPYNRRHNERAKPALASRSFFTNDEAADFRNNTNSFRQRRDWVRENRPSGSWLQTLRDTIAAGRVSQGKTYQITEENRTLYSRANTISRRQARALRKALESGHLNLDYLRSEQAQTELRNTMRGGLFHRPSLSLQDCARLLEKGLPSSDEARNAYRNLVERNFPGFHSEVVEAAMSQTLDTPAANQHAAAAAKVAQQRAKVTEHMEKLGAEQLITAAKAVPTEEQHPDVNRALIAALLLTDAVTLEQYDTLMGHIDRNNQREALIEILQRHRLFSTIDESAMGQAQQFLLETANQMPHLDNRLQEQDVVPILAALEIKTPDGAFAHMPKTWRDTFKVELQADERPTFKNAYLKLREAFETLFIINNTDTGNLQEVANGPAYKSLTNLWNLSPRFQEALRPGLSITEAVDWNGDRQARQAARTLGGQKVTRLSKGCVITDDEMKLVHMVIDRLRAFSQDNTQDKALREQAHELSDCWYTTQAMDLYDYRWGHTHSRGQALYGIELQGRLRKFLKDLDEFAFKTASIVGRGQDSTVAVVETIADLRRLLSEGPAISLRSNLGLNQ